METQKLHIDGQELDVIRWPKGNTMDDVTVRPIINGEYADLTGATNLKISLLLAESHGKGIPATNPRFENGAIKFTVRGEDQYYTGLYKLVVQYTIGESLRTFGGYPFVITPIGSSGCWVDACPDIELPELVLSMEIDIASGGGGGTYDHRELTPESRAAADQHPIDAITNLTPALNNLSQSINQAHIEASNAYGEAISARNEAASAVKRSGDTMTGPLALNADPALDMQAATKQYVDAQVAEVESGTLTFKGFIQTTEPTLDVRDGNYWDESDQLPTSFPHTVRERANGNWDTFVDYTATAFDLWDFGGNAYYYFGNEWKRIDFSGSTFNLNQFQVVNGVVSLKPGGISDTEIADNAQIKRSKIEGGNDLVMYDEDGNILLRPGAKMQLASASGGEYDGMFVEESTKTTLFKKMSELVVGDDITGMTVIFENTNGKTSINTSSSGFEIKGTNNLLIYGDRNDMWWQVGKSEGKVFNNFDGWMDTVIQIPSDVQCVITSLNNVPLTTTSYAWGFDNASINRTANILAYNTGDNKAHWHGHTNDDPEYGIRPTWETPDGVKIGAYLDDIPDFDEEKDPVFKAWQAGTTIAAGYSASAAAARSTAIGNQATVVDTATAGTAIGEQSRAGGEGATAIGTLARAGTLSVSIGRTKNTEYVRAIQIGIGDSDNSFGSTGASSISIGYQSTAANQSQSIGHSATTSATGCIALGTASRSTASQAIAIGYQTSATAGQGIAVGYASRASSTAAVAIGNSAGVSNNSNNGVAIGSNSSVSATNSVAIGYVAVAQKTGSVALGYNAVSASAGGVQLGEGTNSTDNTLQFRSWQLVDSDGQIPQERLTNTLGNINSILDAINGEIL